jgi:hypothetical protein
MFVKCLEPSYGPCIASRFKIEDEDFSGRLKTSTEYTLAAIIAIILEEDVMRLP